MHGMTESVDFVATLAPAWYNFSDRKNLESREPGYWIGKRRKTDNNQRVSDPRERLRLERSAGGGTDRPNHFADPTPQSPQTRRGYTSRAAEHGWAPSQAASIPQRRGRGTVQSSHFETRTSKIAPTVRGYLFAFRFPLIKEVLLSHGAQF